MNLTAISKVVSHALRHEPWLYEIEMDEEGWASVDSVITALRQNSDDWRDLSLNDLTRMVDTNSKRRFEIQGDRIRAFYGHSLPEKLRKQPGNPPIELYHGTDPLMVDRIRDEGLRPMQRQYVHCSVDISTAEQVGNRKSKNPVILTIRTVDAQQGGVVFYEGNHLVWLADAIPARFIIFPQ